MSERSLPDDLAHWPEDPNELLGVSFGVTPRELRRAYNRLIRIYKPEQFPEQFRRIREAYEQLLRIAEWYAPRIEAADAPPADEPQILPAPKEAAADDAAEWTAGMPQPVEEVSQEELNPVRARQPEEELGDLWEEARAGRPAAAYERLVQLTQQPAGRVELYQRLYWLLTLWPDLDARRGPRDWLVQGLLATGLAGPLRELYREEVTDDPDEALSERYERLLEAAASPALLAELIEWRFQAAVRRERWDVLDQDLVRLRPRFGFNDEELWLRLLFSLADNIAGVGDEEAVRLLAACREEIARYEHLASTMSHSFDRFDLLVEASSGWLKLYCQNRVPGTLLQVIGNSWSRPFAEIRGPLTEVLESMTNNPPRWLDHLDEMRECAPAALALFGELLDRLEVDRESMRGEPRDPERLKRLVLSVLPQLNVAGYDGERTRLLMFCVREDVAPEEMAGVASSFSGGWEELGAAWASLLMRDWPLRYVCRACRLFWD